MNKLFSLFFLLSTCCLFSCSKKVYLSRTDAYLNASSVESKSKYLAKDYHSFFMEKKGMGKDKTAAMESFGNWDGPLRPDVKILAYTIKGRSVQVTFNEQNDFSKLIDFPGWKGTTSILFNNKGLIVESIYVPDSTNPDYKKWLNPAIIWLEKNEPEELNDVYQNKKLIQTETSAYKWKELLQQWKDQK